MGTPGTRRRAALRLFAFCLAAGLLLAGRDRGSAAADDTGIDAIAARLDRCQSLPDHADTMATNGCFSDAIEAADKVLAQTIRAATQRLQAAGREDAAERKDASEIARRLVASQQAWTAYRTAECALQSTDMLGGSGEAASDMNCEFKLTRARIKSLAQWLKARG